MLNGFHWFGNNRKNIHVRARKGSGGVGVFVKNELLCTFSIEIIEQSLEGIIALKFSHKYIDYNRIRDSALQLKKLL